uniref:Protein quiver n=2 Tax=Bursaphelenchus xylophilus TaxID=6326 RepID=A0A1I7SGW3_BURXY
HVCHAIQCYDSFMRGDPTQTASCGEDQVCFSEFYALSKHEDSPHISEWYVDRFCVYRQQCLMRGIGPDCVTVNELDKVVRRTFRKKLEHHIKDGWNRLLHTQFCCCESDYCNRLDLNELHDLFNISTDASVYHASEMTANSTYQLNFPFLLLLFFVILQK